MATEQYLKGLPGKRYSVINNFNKGYNTSVSDGVLSDNVFRTLVNYEMKEEGIISKRKGLKDNGLGDLVKMFYDLVADPTSFTDLLNPGVTFSTVLTGKLNGATSNSQNAHNEIFKMLKDTITYTDANTASESINVIYDKVIHLNIINDQMINDFNEFEENMLLWDIKSEVEFDIILGGYYMFKSDLSSYLNPVKKNVFKYIKCKVSLDNASSLIESPEITLSLDIKVDKTTAITTSTVTSKINLLDSRLYDQKFLKVITYNDKSYFTTGYNLYQISAGLLTIISASNAYKPNAIEISNIGFNILATTPLEYFDSGTGTVDAIKGVFLTLSGEPVKSIPTVYTTTVNKEFKINVIAKGSTALGTPKYRPDNGEIDETLNPYKDLTGSYGASPNTHIFTCTDFNLEGKFEIKITKGETAIPYIGYFTAEPQQIKEIGKVSDVAAIVNSSLYCMIMNNQLVLYGGHGYIFFSEYDNFYYFPNYNYIYAIDESGEEVNTIKYFRQFYAVSLGKKWKRLSGSFPFSGDTDGLFPLNDFVGCTNPNSIRQIENNLVFLSKNGLYMLKQGYTGEGTENIQQIDLGILGDYPKDDVMNAVVKGNTYVLTMGNIVLIYNYALGAYYKYIYNVTEDTGYTSVLSALFSKDSFGIDY